MLAPPPSSLGAQPSPFLAHVAGKRYIVGRWFDSIEIVQAMKMKQAPEAGGCARGDRGHHRGDRLTGPTFLCFKGKLRFRVWTPGPPVAPSKQTPIIFQFWVR